MPDLASMPLEHPSVLFPSLHAHGVDDIDVEERVRLKGIRNGGEM